MENICGNCINWRDPLFKRIENVKRLCIESKRGNTKMFSGCGLYTSADFSCILFKEKVNKDGNIKETA